MDIRICAYAEPAISGKKFPRRKNTVTEIGFGYGTKSRDGATRCKPRGFALRHVGCVDQRPGRIHPGMVEQPFDRPHARPGEAILDFPDLLGRMDVHGTAIRQRNDFRELRRGDGAQTVRRHANSRIL